MSSETGVTKEEDDEEDDTMQNTVVLFSNTDKFVLLQVQPTHRKKILAYLKHRFANSFYHHHRFNASFHFAGHVCCMRQLWKGRRGAVAGVRSVRPVLPSLLREQQSKSFCSLAFVLQLPLIFSTNGN